MRKNYRIYLPSVPGSLEEEWEECLGELVKNASTGYRLLKLNIFISQPDYESYIKARQYIGKSIAGAFGDRSPAYSITVHPPEYPWKVAVEALVIPYGQARITTKIRHSVPYVVINDGSYKEVIAAGLCNTELKDNIREASEAAFNEVITILELEGMSMNNIVRQWNYIGNILEVKGGYQNYQVFNEVRNDYYSKYRTISGYPAATGIGMKLGGVSIDFTAVSASDTMKIMAVNNPNQINAYEYGQVVLKGLASRGRSEKHAPQFERALLLVNKTASNLLISGTASIIGQSTIGIGDVREQTKVTIENIKKLTDSDRISQMAGDSLTSYGRYAVVRVYIRNREDFDDVKSICNDHYQGVPLVFIEADICRDDLLTEIEGEYIP